MGNAFIFHPKRPRSQSSVGPFGTKVTFAVSTASNQLEPARSVLIRRSTTTIRHDPQPCSLTKDDIPRLRDRWLEEIRDITGPIPLTLPPFHEVNHCIPLIGPAKLIKHRYSKCPDSLCPQLMDKIKCYIAAGWWEERMYHRHCHYCASQRKTATYEQLSIARSTISIL